MYIFHFLFIDDFSLHYPLGLNEELMIPAEMKRSIAQVGCFALITVILESFTQLNIKLGFSVTLFISTFIPFKFLYIENLKISLKFLYNASFIS